MKRSAIPFIPPMQEHQTREILLAMKENIELLAGVRGNKLTSLSDSATLADCITAINRIIDRLS